VHNWLNGEYLPKESTFSLIQAELFGDNPDFKDWREDLVRAYRRSDESTGAEFFDVPAQLGSFVGRTHELGELKTALAVETPDVERRWLGRAALHGLPGVGKTALAAEYAYTYGRLYTGVWWCTASTRAALLGNLATLATVLKVGPRNQVDVETAAKSALRAITRGTGIWLLIYDNVTNPQDILDLFPKSGARLLITSRHPNWSAWATAILLDVLPPANAIQLLQHRAERDDPGGAAVLASALGWLPLALDHVAAYCQLDGIQFSDCALEVKAILDELPPDTAYPRTVMVTFTLAMKLAAKGLPPVEQLMSYLGHCSPERIPMILVEGAIDDEALRRKAIGRLAAAALLRHDSFGDGTPAIIVHRLVQAVAQVRSEAKGLTESAIRRSTTCLRAIFPVRIDTDPKVYPLCGQLLPHLMALWEIDRELAPRADLWVDLFLRAGTYCYCRAFYRLAEQFFRNALQVTEKVFGPEDTRVAEALNQLALSLADLGNLTEARTLLERVLAINENVLGPKHIRTATSLNNLAHVRRMQKDFDGVRSLLTRSLAITQEVCGPEHPDTASAFSNLASLHLEYGHVGSAQKLAQHALEIREKIFKDDHPDIAFSLNNLGATYEATKDYERAIPLCARAADIFERTLGAHPHTAETFHNLAGLYEVLGSFAQAQTCLERSFAIRANILGLEHTLTASVFEDLARVTWKQRKYSSACQLHEEVLAACDITLGSEHIGKAFYLDHFARMLRGLDNLSGARICHERSLAIRQLHLGLSHPETADAFNALGQLLVDTQDFRAAQSHYERGLAICENLSGPDDPNTAVWLRNVARLRMIQGDLAGARPLFERALEIREWKLGPAHGMTAESFDDLGKLLTQQKDLPAAASLYQRILTICESELGENHLNTAMILSNLAVIVQHQGHYAKSQELFERAIAIRERLLGPDDPQTAEVITYLGDNFIDQGKSERARPLYERALAIYLPALGPEHSTVKKLQSKLTGSS
jgi:tetratricopeptide (TPR) repeat protein